MKAKEEAWNLVPQGQRAKWIEDSLSSATVEVSYTDLLALIRPAPVASGGQHSSYCAFAWHHQWSVAEPEREG